VTPKGSGRLYSGLRVQAAGVAPPTGQPQKSGESHWWILGIVLGAVGGCILVGTAIFLLSRRAKAKPAG